MSESHDGAEQFSVVVNAEGQYSLWPLDREPPAGWEVAGASGSREDCLAFVGRAWEDMRPRGLREKMGKS